MKNNIFYGFLTAALLATLVASPAKAESDFKQWLWSQTSPAVNRSTEALANHHPKRAARAADRLIARHNLCLALIMTRDSAAAEPHCRAALRTPASFPVLRIRGALIVVQDAPHDEAPTLATVVKANIARAYGDSMVNTVAAWK